MNKVIDTRGYSCPEPVLMVKKMIDAGEASVTAIVDLGAPLQNVSRMAKYNGYSVSEVKLEDGVQLKIQK